MSTFNRYTEQNLRSFIKGLLKLKASVTFGASGAAGTKGAGTLVGNGITSVTKLGTGVYRIIFDNKLNKILDVKATLIPAVTAGDIAAGSLSGGTLYRIKTVGTTVWTDNGARTAQVGEPFVATGTASGTGVAEVVPTAQTLSLLVATPASLLSSADSLVVVFVDDAGSALEPASGDVVVLDIEARVSSIDNNGV